MLQRIRNVLDVVGRRCYNVSGMYWKKMSGSPKRAYHDVTSRMSGSPKRTYHDVTSRMSGSPKRTYHDVTSRMSGSPKRTYHDVTSRMSGSPKRTYHDVTSRMSGSPKRTYHDACVPMQQTERYYAPPPHPPPQPQPYKTLRAVGKRAHKLVIRWCFDMVKTRVFTRSEPPTNSSLGIAEPPC